MLWLELGPIWGGGGREAEVELDLSLRAWTRKPRTLRLGPLVQPALALAGKLRPRDGQ